MIYLDNSSTTEPYEEVLDVYKQTSKLGISAILRLCTS